MTTSILPHGATRGIPHVPEQKRNSSTRKITIAFFAVMIVGVSLVAIPAVISSGKFPASPRFTLPRSDAGALALPFLKEPVNPLPFPVAGSAPAGEVPSPVNAETAVAMSPLVLLKSIVLLGFRRVEKKNILDHDERSSLYQKIVSHPGVDISRLADMLGLNKETARYHIRMLSANGKISGLIKQGIARYFPSKETITEYEKIVIHYLWIGTTKQILTLLLETPGLTRQAIARELGIAGPSVTWQMQRLADDGIIEMKSEGKFVKYFLTRDGVETLGSIHRTGAGILPA